MKAAPREKCPCGSGRTYQDCCLKSGKLYVSFFENYLGEKVWYDEVVEERCLSRLNALLDQIRTQGKQPIWYALEQLKTLYSVIDDGLEGTIAPRSFCRPGCSMCCRLLVECSAIEAENIRRFVVEQFSDNDREILEKRLMEVKNHHPTEASCDPQVLQSFFDKGLECVFQKSDGLCRVYPVRPLLCRTYYSFWAPEYCADTNHV